MEGTRPFLVEIQGLVSRSSYGVVRQKAQGFDSNRLAFSLGTSYKISKYLVADLTYFTWFVLTRRIDNNVGAALGT